MVASLVQLMLELEGYEVRLALNEPDGFFTYLQFRPDLVITDIQMPGKTGFDLMNRIREEDPTVKTIYMSGNLDQFYSQLEKEKNKYQINSLQKPFSMEELIGRVSELVH
jgi:DNA-binding response OmpR family regulator